MLLKALKIKYEIWKLIFQIKKDPGHEFMSKQSIWISENQYSKNVHQPDKAVSGLVCLSPSSVDIDASSPR